MDVVFLWFLTFVCSASANNLAVNKPTYQSSTYATYTSGKGNDGDMSTTACTRPTNVQSYWQADLEGEYWVSRITVTSDGLTELAGNLMNALIGVSSKDARFEDEGFIQCGQWPGSALPSHSITFNCILSYPVQYVRLYRPNAAYTCVAEVQVYGLQDECQTYVFSRTEEEMITTPTQSMYAVSSSDCGITCIMNQPCSTFSYSSEAEPPCLLATNVSMGNDGSRVTFKLDKDLV